MPDFQGQCSSLFPWQANDTDQSYIFCIDHRAKNVCAKVVRNSTEMIWSCIMEVWERVCCQLSGHHNVGFHPLPCPKTLGQWPKAAEWKSFFIVFSEGLIPSILFLIFSFWGLISASLALFLGAPYEWIVILIFSTIWFGKLILWCHCWWTQMKLFKSLENLLSFSFSLSHTLIHTWHCLIRSAVDCLVELQAENIRNTLEQEMVFFARLIGGFQVADDITPIKIDNYDK